MLNLMSQSGRTTGGGYYVCFKETLITANSIQGQRYFECKQKYGSFVKPDRVEIGEFEDEELLSDLEEM